MRSLALAIAIAASPASAQFDLGGDIVLRASRIAAMQQTGQEVRITGTCASACTMQLAIGCVTPSARLGFHAPRGVGRKLTEKERQRWAAIIAGYYPDGLAAWYLTGPAFDRRATWISGADAIRMGAKECE